MLTGLKKYLSNVYTIIKDSIAFLYEGIQRRQSTHYVKSFLSLLHPHLAKFHYYISHGRIHQNLMAPLQKRVKDLHATLPPDDRYSYSILVPLGLPDPTDFKSCLTSLCNLSPTQCEILIGSTHQVYGDCRRIIDELSTQYPGKISLFEFENDQEPLLNLLAKKSLNNFLLIAYEQDWIRPDLLFRYEQLLRTFADPENIVITCDEGTIGQNDHILPNKPVEKILPLFPYHFQKSFGLQGLLIPKKLWDSTGGLRSSFSDVESDDLFFRLDLAGARFNKIPFPLYFCRTGKNVSSHGFNKNAFICSLKEYAQKKGLEWKISDGDHPDYIHPQPEIPREHSIQVIIPFKDQKTLTLSCMESLLKQKGVDLKITAVDNGSADGSIAVALKDMGAEVITINEPFNFSRLNNLAVQRTKTAQKCDLLLFLNNDVELEEDAIQEMVRWIDQPDVGIVGCRLNYPDGRLQHGGVQLNAHYLPERLCYNLIEKFQVYDQLKKTRSIHIADGIIGACLLMKRELFLAVGGYDEIWYPVCGSDTDLGEKVIKKGFKCLYTPYAVGIHHESVSRKQVLEDVDVSRWLFELTAKMDRRSINCKGP